MPDQDYLKVRLLALAATLQDISGSDLQRAELCDDNAFAAGLYRGASIASDLAAFWIREEIHTLDDDGGDQDG